jgi:5-methyltetrahydropteroyltriglutamate--homocysteine methyltransferase
MFTTTRETMLPTTVTGSWPRPRWMTENLGGTSFSSGMTDVRYREQFLDAITTVVHDQQRAGLDILTNGDYHHDEEIGGQSWIVYPLERLGGVSEQAFPLGMMPYPPGSILHEVFAGLRFPGIDGEITEGTPLEFDQIWRVAQARSDRPVKFGTVCAQMMASTAQLRTDRYAPDKRQLMWDVATVMNAELRKLADAGCQAIQIEEPLLHTVGVMANDPALVDFLVDVFNHEVEGLDGVEIWIHTCWGNPNMQRTAGDTSYEKSIEVLLERLHGDVLTIEWKNNDQPTLPLLEKYRGHLSKKIAFGVIDHRTLQVESPHEVAADIRTILQSVDPEHVVLSSNCGFGHEGANRRIAYYKASSLAQGANIVREELGAPTTTVRAADPNLQIG